MQRSKLTHYYKDSEIDYSLLRYYVNVKILSNDKGVYYLLTIIDKNRQELIYRFETLEDVVGFIQDVVNESKDFFEIIEGYDFFVARNEQRRLMKLKKNN